MNSLKGRKSSELKLKIIFLKTWKIDLQLEQNLTKQSGKRRVFKNLRKVSSEMGCWCLRCVLMGVWIEKGLRSCTPCREGDIHHFGFDFDHHDYDGDDHGHDGDYDVTPYRKGHINYFGLDFDHHNDYGDSDNNII